MTTIIGVRDISRNINILQDYDYAKESGCEVFITEDKEFYDCGLVVVGVDAFLSELPSD